MILIKSFNKEFIKESIKSHWKHLLIIGIVNPLVILLYFLNDYFNYFNFIRVYHIKLKLINFTFKFEK